MNDIYLGMKTNFSNVSIAFYDHPNEASIGLWNTMKKSWQTKSSICEIDRQVFHSNNN